MNGPSDLDIVRELNRIKVMFQQRTIAAVLTEQPHVQPSALGDDHGGKAPHQFNTEGE